jgi:hypothetical protein
MGIGRLKTIFHATSRELQPCEARSMQIDVTVKTAIHEVEYERGLQQGEIQGLDEASANYGEPYPYGPVCGVER